MIVIGEIDFDGLWRTIRSRIADTDQLNSSHALANFNTVFVGRTVGCDLQYAGNHQKCKSCGRCRQRRLDFVRTFQPSLPILGSQFNLQGLGFSGLLLAEHFDDDLLVLQIGQQIRKPQGIDLFADILTVDRDDFVIDLQSGPIFTWKRITV